MKRTSNIFYSSNITHLKLIPCPVFYMWVRIYCKTPIGWCGLVHLILFCPQMYIALISGHALALCGCQFITCVRVQWRGEAVTHRSILLIYFLMSRDFSYNNVITIVIFVFPRVQWFLPSGDNDADDLPLHGKSPLPHLHSCYVQHTAPLHLQWRDSEGLCVIVIYHHCSISEAGFIFDRELSTVVPYFLYCSE